jgi:sigma-B regulation protein RsbU (phosphoserine phosphatase)
MVYSNAGLNVSPLVYSKDRFELIRLPGIPISNWTDKPSYANGTVEFRPGDRLFLYSDGILEMKNKEDEQYGEKRLLDVILDNSVSSRQLLLDVKKSAFQFAGAKSASELPDDVTLAMLEIK